MKRANYGGIRRAQLLFYPARLAGEARRVYSSATCSLAPGESNVTALILTANLNVEIGVGVKAYDTADTCYLLFQRILMAWCMGFLTSAPLSDSFTVFASGSTLKMPYSTFIFLIARARQFTHSGRRHRRKSEQT